MEEDDARVWVLDGEGPSIDHLIEVVGASHRQLESIAFEIARIGQVRDTRLPGWTNAHLLCHLERNAASHIRMLEGASAGDLVDQYLGGNAGRIAEIDSGSIRPLSALASDLATTNRQLEALWHAMDPGAWHNPTRARAGVRPAYSCLWARWREVEIHLVDIDAGSDVVDWPMEFAVAGLDVSFQGLEQRSVKDRLPQGVCVELLATPDVGTWLSHPDSKPTHVGTAPAQLLLGWVVGRVHLNQVTWTNGPPELDDWP